MSQAAGVAEFWKRGRRFLSEGLWLHEFEPRTWTSRGVRLLQFGHMVVEGFVRDQLLLRAYALAFITAISIVPVLAIVSSVVTALGITQNVIGPVLDQIGVVAPKVAEQLETLISEANITGLGSASAALLFLTTVLGISHIERSLNHIWGVRQQRPLIRKLSDYLLVLIVAPALLGAGLSAATSVQSQWIVQQMLEIPLLQSAYDLGLSQLPKGIVACGFAFLYWFLPNTAVRPLAALLGGVVAAIGVTAALSLYVGLSVGAARANALYGAFAQLPLLFIWIYLFWAIVLVGAEIAFAFQTLELYVREVRGEQAGSAEREAIGLSIAVEISRAFRDGVSPWTSDTLSDALRVPVRTVRDVLVPLQRARIVSAMDPSEREGGWQLGRPADAVRVVDVIAALRGEREPTSGDADVARAVEGVLSELAEGEAKAADGRTLADLLQRTPPLPRPEA